MIYNNLCNQKFKKCQLTFNKLSNDKQLHSLYHSPNIIRVIKFRRLRWADHVARMEEGRSAFKILTGTSTGKRPLGRPRCRWKDNIRMDFRENDDTEMKPRVMHRFYGIYFTTEETLENLNQGTIHHLNLAPYFHMTSAGCHICPGRPFNLM